jgi:death-on-curing protein
MADELYGGHGNPMPAFQFLGAGGADLLDSALALFEAPYYESDVAATAAMFHSLVNNHPFQDGNKRFAIVATQVALLVNGRVLVLSGNDWERIALATASGQMKPPDLVRQFEPRFFSVLANRPETGESWADMWTRTIGLEEVGNLAQVMISMKNQLATLKRADPSPNDAD